MAQDNKVVRFDAQKTGNRFALPHALIRLRDVSGQSLKTMLAGFFDRSDDALFELADKAASNQDQSAYFDAMREMRLRRKSMTVSILQYVSRAFNDLGKFHPGGSGGRLDEVDQDSLSLLDHSELEQRVAIENLVNKLRNQHSDAILMLTARVGHLAPSYKLSDSQMPLSPEVICGGVAEACADLDIDIRAKLVVLKLFDRLLADNLGHFYHEANRTLIAEGVLPDMKRPPVPGRASPAKPGRGEQSRPAEGSSDERHSPGLGVMSPDQAGGTFSELSALLHQGRSGTGPSSIAGGQIFLDTGTLMTRLNDVQGLPAQWSQGRVVSLTEQLEPVLTAVDGKACAVGQVDSDVINLVSMLFDFILEDRQLHPVMKALLGRLQIPVLKVALSDRNFFNRGGHPVRKLLNELAMSAIGWAEKKNGQRDPLREKIETVVERVLNEFTDNVDLFSELLSDFSHFMDLDRRRELVEQRLRDAEEGRARQERAGDSSKLLIEEVIAGHELPGPVQALLAEAWSKYLQWTVLREGEDSQAWARAGELTRKLVWSVDPRPVTDNTRTELLRAIPSIVDDLRHALQEISWDPFATDAMIRDLELVHVDVFQQLVTAHPQPAPEPLAEQPGAERVTPPEPYVEVPRAVAPQDTSVPGAADTAVEQALVQPELPGIDASWLDKADRLRVGSWIELNRDGAKTRCKLAAFIKATGKYIFVNRSGAKVAEYQRESLAAAMASDDITMLDDGLIFDRALESIIDNLRSSRKD